MKLHCSPEQICLQLMSCSQLPCRFSPSRRCKLNSKLHMPKSNKTPSVGDSLKWIWQHGTFLGHKLKAAGCRFPFVCNICAVSLQKMWTSLINAFIHVPAPEQTLQETIKWMFVGASRKLVRMINDCPTEPSVASAEAKPEVHIFIISSDDAFNQKSKTFPSNHLINFACTFPHVWICVFNFFLW